jgi:N-acyl-D-aspartate/D-glutamate deacylase
VIHDVKAGHAGKDESVKLSEILQQFSSNGVTTVISGSTKLSILRKDVTTNLQSIDSSEQLTLKVVERSPTSCGANERIADKRLRTAYESDHDSVAHLDPLYV